MKCVPALLTGILGASCLDATPVSFWSQSGSNSSVNEALDGMTVADQLGLNPYNGYIGEMVLMPTDLNTLAALAADTAGIVTADNGGTFSGKRGLAAFCIDSETSFKTSASLAQTYSYEAFTFSAANSRYLDENVPYYNSNGLKRAAYLLENNYSAAHAGGNTQAAALQAAIWEVLYDADPSVTLGSGEYYIRTNTGNSSAKARAVEVRDQANAWLEAASAAQWGGDSYDPAKRVMFWLDPTAVNLDQSVITLNPGSSFQAIPEPRSEILIAGALGMTLLFRRRLRGQSPGSVLGYQD